MNIQTIGQFLLLVALPLMLAPKCGDKDEDNTSTEATGAEAKDTAGTTETFQTTFPPVGCVPPSADFSDGTPGQAGIDLDAANGTCAAVTGLPPSDFLVLDYTGDATIIGSGSGFHVLSISYGSFVNGDGHFALTGLPTDVPIMMEMQDQTDASFVTVWFTVDATGDVHKLAEARAQFLER